MYPCAPPTSGLWLTRGWFKSIHSLGDAATSRHGATHRRVRAGALSGHWIALRKVCTLSNPPPRAHACVPWTFMAIVCPLTNRVPPSVIRQGNTTFATVPIEKSFQVYNVRTFLSPFVLNQFVRRLVQWDGGRDHISCTHPRRWIYHVFVIHFYHCLKTHDGPLTYQCDHLTVRIVGPQFPKKVQSVAVHKKMTLAASGSNIYVCHRGKTVPLT